MNCICGDVKIIKIEFVWRYWRLEGGVGEYKRGIVGEGRGKFGEEGIGKLRGEVF